MRISDWSSDVCSSDLLHLGLVGPRIVEFGSPPDAAAQLESNPDSWLRFTDLVLIDPVGTGWSRAADPDEAERFWSVERDAEALAKVIALYVADNARTASPKVLLGESYGGFRAAKLRSEEHTSELQSLMRISYAVFCLKKKKHR